MASTRLPWAKYRCDHKSLYKLANTMIDPLPLAVLLIDVGNTRLKAGWVIPASNQRETRSIALSHADSAQLADWIANQPIQPVAAVGVNVAGDSLAHALDAMLLQQHAIRIHWNHSQSVSAGVRNGYALPAQLGPDRWMGMIGLSAQQDDSNTPMMLANFGTATTIDTLVRCHDVTAVETTVPIDASWQFAGGLILPGVELMRTSLNTGTARLPAAQGHAVAFPDNTQLAISSGIAAAQAGAVLRQWLAIRNKFHTPPRVFSAGGAWAALETEVQTMLADMQATLGLAPQPVQYLPSPVLDGLAQLACTNQPY